MRNGRKRSAYKYIGGKHNMGKEKNKFKRVLLIAFIIILLLLAFDVVSTCIKARKIPHHFASAEEGRELLLANTEYYSDFSQNDIDYRLGRKGGTLDELLNATTDEIRDFNIFEKYLIDRNIAKMVTKLGKNGCKLPEIKEDIVYIKTDMNVEGGNSGYTHGTQIYLNSVNILVSAVPGGGEYFEHLMWHELFHCLTRNDPDFRAEVYSLISFTVADHDFEMPPCVSSRYFHNPDVEHHNSYATFNIDGKDTDCFLVWICTADYPENGSTNGFETDVALVPTDGTNIYYTRDQASNFDEVLGQNTNYVIDPEECMADNFADAMQYGTGGRDGKGYPDPEIIQGIIDILKN